MTYALHQDELELAGEVTAAYQPEAHPHAPAGSSVGGQFTDAGNAAKKAATKSARSGQSRSGRSHRPSGQPARKPDDGTLSYDPSSNRGTGYGNPAGDPRVHKLQEALIRFHLTGARGKPLKKDGKLGPETTAAVKKAQHRLGLPEDGKVTPALLEKLSSLKTLPMRRAHTAKKAVHAATDAARHEFDNGTCRQCGY
jgi:peptidoglycan hydrolase-like protein with peptidoglycan-binding domain